MEKERSMEHWLLDRRRPVAADAAELRQAAKTVEPVPYSHGEVEGAGEGRVAEVLVSDRGHQAPEIASGARPPSWPLASNPTRPSGCPSTTCLTRGW